MTSSLAGTVAHGARGGRGVSTSHFCRIFPGLSGTPRYSPELPGSGSHNNVLLGNFYYNALGAFFDALIQRTDGCTEFLWLLVQTYHIIRCSHKRCKNRHFNQHMIFRYCIEGSGEPVQTCILPRAFAASTRDLDIYYIVQ